MTETKADSAILFPYCGECNHVCDASSHAACTKCVHAAPDRCKTCRVRKAVLPQPLWCCYECLHLQPGVVHHGPRQAKTTSGPSCVVCKSHEMVEQREPFPNDWLCYACWHEHADIPDSEEEDFADD